MANKAWISRHAATSWTRVAQDGNTPSMTDSSKLVLRMRHTPEARACSPTSLNLNPGAWHVCHLRPLASFSCQHLDIQIKV